MAITDIKLRGQRKRRVAGALLRFHQKRRRHPLTTKTAALSPVRVVCVSDTHNKQPDLPPGDVLIHAGDLTDTGSFDEVQAGLAWLSSQPHRHKVYVAGNHDVLLDESFLAKHPERRYGQTRTKADLDWGSVIYLEDSSVTLEIHADADDPSDAPSSQRGTRSLTVRGSPWTPQYGTSAFQYRPNALDHWDHKMGDLIGGSPRLDILVTHGPPRHHLDQRDFYRAGCPYLADKVYDLRPRLMVFGHIHAAYGREDTILDGVQKAYGDVMIGWSGWGTLAWMAISVAWGRVSSMLNQCVQRDDRLTTFVNAAVVAGRENELRNPPIVVEI